MSKAILANGQNDEKRVIFHCPGCGDNHQIIVGVWGWNSSLDTPTFEGSVLVGGVQWDPSEPFYKLSHSKVPPGSHIVCHSFVRDGNIQFLPDSTHNLSGQTVELPELESWFLK